MAWRMRLCLGCKIQQIKQKVWIICINSTAKEREKKARERKIEIRRERKKTGIFQACLCREGRRRKKCWQNLLLNVFQCCFYQGNVNSTKAVDKKVCQALILTNPLHKVEQIQSVIFLFSPFVLLSCCVRGHLDILISVNDRWPTTFWHIR